MSLMDDKELKKLIERKNQERWFELFLILCELDNKKEIERITYKGNELYVKDITGKTTLYLL